MEPTASYHSGDRIEETVYLGLSRITAVRQRLRSSAPSRTFAVFKLRVLSGILHRDVKFLERVHTFPDNRDDLCESLNALIKFRERVNDSVNLAIEKRLSNLFLGQAVEDCLKATCATLQRIADVWQVELNGRFPELFSALDESIASIQPSALPEMNPTTLELANKAIAARRDRTAASVEEWARQLTEDILSKND